MADIIFKNKKDKKINSLKVDLTPMVDLGFLLIAFFMFTTTLSSAYITPLAMPIKDISNSKLFIKNSTVMTVLLDENHKIYCYYGMLQPNTSSKIFILDNQNKAFRNELFEFKSQINLLIQNRKLSNKDNPIIIVKPNKNSTYKDLIEVLDELKISDLNNYFILDITEQDKKLII